MTNFQCAICKTNFTKKSSFHRHNILAHCGKLTADNSYGCIHCSKRYVTEFSLNEHVQKCHTSSAAKKENNGGYICVTCGASFSNEIKLKQHTRIHSTFSNLCGEATDMIFAEKSVLSVSVHENIHEIGKSLTISVFTCETCDSRFDNDMELKQHELEIHNVVPSLEELKPYGCTFCDKRFTTKGKCNLHLETHSESPNYECTKCDKRFYRRDLLREHIFTHTGYRTHVCKICGLAYSQKSSLKTHENTHLPPGETINCEKCGKLFHSKQALNFHIKAHEGNFRFTCEICGKKFVRKCHYNLHVASHSAERPFKCEKCTATYKTSKHLREHTKKVHQNDSNFTSLFDSIYADDEAVTQPNLINDYISPINSLSSELSSLKSKDFYS